MRKYLKNLGAFSIGPLVGAVFSFVTIPIITYFISPEEYGRVSMFTLLQNILGMVVYLGLDQAYVKFYNEEDDKNKLMLHSLVPALTISFIVSFFLYIFRSPLALWLYNSSSEWGCVLILMVYLPFFVIERFIFVRFRMAQKGGIYSFFSILNKALLLILSFTFLQYIYCGYQSVIYATVLAQIIGTILMALFFIRKDGVQRVKIDKILIVKLLKYGLPLVPATLVGWLLNSMDKMMIRSFCNYEQLGLYTAALKIVSVLAIVQSCFATFWSPIAFKWSKERKNIKYFEIVGKIISVIMISVFIMILCFKGIIINILSPQYHDAVRILPFLLIYPIMYTISEITVVGIYFSGKSFSTIIVAVCSCVLNIVANSWLIPKYGSVGASIATGGSYIVFFWLRTLISRKVWIKFDVSYYVYTTCLILALSFINVLFEDVTALFVNIIALVLFLLLNKGTIKYCYTRLIYGE